MKSKSILLGIFATALAACHNDENIPGGTGTDSGNGAVSFTASIDGAQATRAHDTFWDANDRIGITGTSGGTPYVNVAYETKDADGKFTAAVQGTEIYYQDDAEVTFTAYYPYTEALTEGTKITANTKLQSDQQSFDFLHATQTGSKATAASPVSFKFIHRMAKVVLTIQKGSGVSFEEVKAAVLALQGLKDNGSFHIASGEATATGDALTSAWTFAGNAGGDANNNAPAYANDQQQTVAYTLILFPQAFDAALPLSATLVGKQTFNAKLDFTAANTDAGDAPAGNYLAAGRQYNLSVTLHKTALTVDGCSIKEWENADGGNVDAN